MDPLGIEGRQLGFYRVDEYQAKGAFGFVYSATEVSSGARVAIKVLNPSAAWPQRQEFDNEAALLVGMTGASRVVSYLGSGTHAIPVATLMVPLTLSFHVFELAECGMDLLLVDLPSVSWSSRLALFRDVVLGVHQMHLKDIVHRDIKTANCLLFEDGQGVMSKVADLGRARDLRAAPAHSALAYQFMRGDPSFGAPEFLWGTGQDRGSVYKAAELYGLGSLLVELATGHGVTTLAGPLLHPQGPIQDQATMAQVYRANIATIRASLEVAFSLFEKEAPAAIRPQAAALVRQLCDPDPQRRLPPTGSRAPDQGLNWLLRRTDILSLTLRNAIAQAAGLAAKKKALT